MLGQDILEGGKGIRSNVKGADFHKIKEEVELRRVKNDLGQGFMSQAFPENKTTVQRNFRLFVPLQQRK
jgi:hypothetical protein